jgi:hypothetical protein
MNGAFARRMVRVGIHARPADVGPGPTLATDGGELPTLDPGAAWAATSLPTTFEEAAAALEALPRMFVEPDGAFVLRGEPTDGTPASRQAEGWRWEGLLHDRGDRLHFVELFGQGPEEALDAILAAVAPGISPAFQLLREAAYLDEPTFRRWAFVE